MQWILALVLLGTGATGLLFVRHREFVRTNAAGVQEFDGFLGYVGAKLLERAVTAVSVFFLLLGALALA